MLVRDERTMVFMHLCQSKYAFSTIQLLIKGRFLFFKTDRNFYRNHEQSICIRDVVRGGKRDKAPFSNISKKLRFYYSQMKTKLSVQKKAVNSMIYHKH